MRIVRIGGDIDCCDFLFSSEFPIALRNKLKPKNKYLNRHMKIIWAQFGEQKSSEIWFNPLNEVFDNGFRHQ